MRSTLLVVNAANIEKDWAWCQSHNAAGAILENSCDNVGQLAIQGPLAQQVLQRLTDVDLSTIPLLHLQGRHLRWLP